MFESVCCWVDGWWGCSLKMVYEKPKHVGVYSVFISILLSNNFECNTVLTFNVITVLVGTE
jgi:hypothetical protein